MLKDPVCGMKVNEKGTRKKKLFLKKENKNYFFCSSNCKEKFRGKGKGKIWYRTEDFGKIFPWFLGIVLVAGFISALIWDFMLLYMGIFFIVFSVMKMPDWKGFVNAFSKYDLIAVKIKVYAWIYPGVEFILGILFLTGNYITTSAWIALSISGFGAIGVGKNMFSKNKVQCACLGTKINVPLTKVTLLENILMMIMTSKILFF